MTEHVKQRIAYLVFLCAVVVAAYRFPLIVKLLLLSLALAYILEPLVYFLHTHGVGRRIAAMVVVLLAIFLIILFCGFVAPRMMVELVKGVAAMEQLDHLWGGLLHQKNGFFSSETGNAILHQLSQSIETWATGWFKETTTWMGEMLKALPTYVLSPVFAYYFLVEPEWFLSYLSRFIPSGSKTKSIEIIAAMDEIVGGFIKSQLVLGVVISVLTWLVLIGFHVKYALAIAIIGGLMNIIPYFGPVFGIIPAFFSALTDSMSKALLIAFLLILIQQLESNVISPRLVGNSIDMHPVFVILLLLAGGEVFGFWGLLFAIPVGAAARVVFQHLWRRFV